MKINVFVLFLNIEYTNNDYVYNTTENESESRPNFERHTLESFATYVVSHTPSSVQGVMDRLHSMIYPDGDQGRAFMHSGVLTLLRNVLQVSVQQYYARFDSTNIFGSEY